MKISTKGRYALRLMIDLAINGTESYVPIKSVSQRQEISEKYLEQIITQLSRAKLVKSARGAQGGYKLVRDPKDYTAGDKSFEPPLRYPISFPKSFYTHQKDLAIRPGPVLSLSTPD